MSSWIEQPVLGQLYHIEIPVEREEHESEAYAVLWGISVNASQIREALGFGEFKDSLTTIPSNGKFYEPTEQVLRFYLKPAVPDPKFEGALEQQTWKQFVALQCLTLGDVLQLRTGDQIKVLVMDRNLEDITTSINQSDVVLDPQTFFRDSWAIYTHRTGTQGHILWAFEDEDEFEFDIEYKADHWYPLCSGTLPSEDCQRLAHFGEAGGKHYSAFPHNTGVGFRGPMLLWDKLPALPNIYWHDEVAKEL